MRTPAHNRQLWRNAALVCFWLVVVNIFALISLNRLNLTPDRSFQWIDTRSCRPEPQWNPINLHDQWDSYWFLDVAQNGYYLRGNEQISNVVFFPLYPLAVRGMGWLTGGNLTLAGWIVSSLFLVATMWILTRLVQEFHPDHDPVWTALFLLTFPTAFFLNAVYSESMFLFFSIAAFYYMLRERFWTAAVFAALASATRLAGIFLVFPLLVEIVRSCGWKAVWSRSILPVFLAPSGALAFFTFHYLRFGDFFLYLKVEKWWGRDFSGGLDDFSRIISNNGVANWLVEWFFAFFGFAAAILLLWKYRLSYGIYVLVSISIAFASGGSFGIGRYILVLFPIFLLAAGIRSTTIRHAWILTSTLLFALNTILFSNAYWAG